MVETIRLSAQRGELVLTPEQNQYGQFILLSLEQRGQSIRLGHDAAHLVVDRMLEGFAQVLDDTYKGVIMVFEPHSTLYVKQGDTGGMAIRFQDAQGSTIGDLLLTAEQRKKWLETLATTANLLGA